ncbi:transcriptional regulator [Streptomyces sp. RY43-2]|uniref:Transcriptional regulator n=1 Tax=Streptomyces macrolidinus TaxID=2952607 RepID=A0ABT0ZKP1_9ACTN|nr:transcriptional regulator [Streptomyces macrolidinus]MCN9244147.1 transcriptional regulator [Streptomyces macrolidinus]
MTPVGAPPPRLPTRERTRIPGGGLSPMLSRLAEERATGVLMREGGMLHLSEGQVVYAESPATPGLDALLMARGTLDEDGWREAFVQAGERRRVGRFLIDSGRIGEGALELCHLGALFDAAYFVLGPSSAPVRFHYGEAHWLGPVHPVPVAALERETLRRRELLHAIWPDPTTDDAPLVRTARSSGRTVTPRQGAVLDRIDGVRTAADISRSLGRPAFHTLVDVRRLAAAGVIAAGTYGVAAGTYGGQRQPSAGVADHDPAVPAPGEALPPPYADDPHITLLKRLRDALEAL